jgi:hypothetical protein
MNDVGDVASDVTARVERSREKLAHESQRLISVSTAALESTSEATQSFGKQAESLFKASQDAARNAQDIQKQSARNHGDAFMGGAKFIIESLHSLSVDMTRMLDGEISERTWKAFQKGDISAFTRRLSVMRDEMPLDKARDKFAKDTEFRTYVQRFTRQFEEMYEQAQSNDHGAILCSTIGSSDLGKLYEFLCSVAARSPVTAGTAKAA